MDLERVFALTSVAEKLAGHPNLKALREEALIELADMNKAAEERIAPPKPPVPQPVQPSGPSIRANIPSVEVPHEDTLDQTIQSQSSVERRI